MLLIFSKFFLIYIILITVFFITGFIIIELLPIKIKNNSSRIYNTYFFSTLTGLLVCVIIYSIIKTGFITINSLFLLLLIVFIFRYYHFSKISDIISSLKSKIPVFKKFYKALLLSIPFFLFEAICLLKPGEFNFRLPFGDFIYYSNVSVSLNIFGEENRYFFANAITPEITGLSFYHYFEIWMNSFIAFFSGQPNIVCLMLLTYPILFFITLLGILSVFEMENKIKFKWIILSYFLLLTGSVVLFFYSNTKLFEYGGLDASSNLFFIFSKKMAIILPFIIIVYKCLKHQIYDCVYIVFCILIILSVGMMPGVIAGAFMLPFYFVFTNKSLFLANFKFFAFFIVFLILFALFYYVFGSKYQYGFSNNNIVQNSMMKIFTNFDLKHFFVISVVVFLKLLVLYLPFIFCGTLIYFDLKKKKVNLMPANIFIYIAFFIAFAGYALYGLNLDFIGAEQFLFYSLLFFIVLIMILIIEFYRKNNSVRKKTILSFILLGSLLYNAYYDFNNYKFYLSDKTFNIYSDEYLRTVTNYLDTAQINPHGACVWGKKDFEKYPLNMDGFVGTYYSGGSVKFSNKECIMSYLSILDYYIGDTTLSVQFGLKELSDFTVFVRREKTKNTFYSIEKSKLSYVDQNNIDYIIKYKYGVIPEDLEKRIAYSVTDDLSGESFIVLKKNKFAKTKSY